MQSKILLMVSVLSLTACGGDGETSPSSNATLPANISCGVDFEATKTLDDVAYLDGGWKTLNEGGWRHNNITIQPKGNPSAGGYTLSSSNPDCMQTAEVFGNATPDTWQDAIGIGTFIFAVKQ